MIRYIRTIFEEEEQEKHYIPVRVKKFCSSSYIQYGRNSEKNKTLSIKENLDESKPYLKDIPKLLQNLIHENFN